jgi:hypothetical protein
MNFFLASRLLARAKRDDFRADLAHARLQVERAGSGASKLGLDDLGHGLMSGGELMREAKPMKKKTSQKKYKFFFGLGWM